MNLSVIVTAYNREASLGACLEAIRRCGYADHELIVVDDASRDGTADIARRVADRVITHEKNLGTVCSRISGMKAARGDIIVNVDSDMLVRPDTLKSVAAHFAAHPESHAVTGVASREHPNRNFFSRYKNLFLRYAYLRQPREVDFVYGSLFAVRREGLVLPDPESSFFGEDTCYGQKLARRGMRITHAKDIEGVHMKWHGFFSLMKYDFMCGFSGARIFLRLRGWRGPRKRPIGFAHVPADRLVSVVAALASAVSVLLIAVHPAWSAAFCGFFVFWLLLNIHFLSFLKKEGGLGFSLVSVIAAWVDYLAMASGAAAGCLIFAAAAAGRAGRLSLKR